MPKAIDCPHVTGNSLIGNASQHPFKIYFLSSVAHSHFDFSTASVLLENDLSNLSAVAVFFAKVQCLHFSSSKVRYSRFLRCLLGSFFPFYFVVLKNFNIDFFNWYFVMPPRSAPAYFNSLKLKLMFLSSWLLSIVT